MRMIPHRGKSIDKVLAGKTRLSLVAALSGSAVLVLAWAGCSGGSDSNETATATIAAPATQTPSPSTETAGGAGGQVPVTQVPNPTPLPSPGPISSDWKTLQQPATTESEAVLLRYPPTWSVSPAPPPGVQVKGFTVTLASWDQGAKSGGGPLPLDGIKIDLSVEPISRNIPCTAPKTTATRIGNLQGTFGVANAPANAPDAVAQVYSFEAEHGGFRYCLQAFLTRTTGGASPRLDILSGILSTLKVG
jgi:hypothetical protein